MANIKVTITPASGNQTTLEATGTTVAEALAAVGREVKNMNLFVNGQAATLATPVKDGDTINLAERPKGS